MILPVVERIDPDRLEEVFWRAVGASSSDWIGQNDQFLRSNIGYECMLLARYDRQVAASALRAGK